MTIEGIEDVFAAQTRLNMKKRILNMRQDQTKEEWLALAKEYQAIDSRGNFAYCTKKAIYYGAQIERKTDEAPAEYDWQRRADVGD